MPRQSQNGWPPAGLYRKEAARYVGLGLTHFDKQWRSGALPQPRRFGRRLVWSRFDLDAVFGGQLNSAAAEPVHGQTGWEDFT